MVGIGVFVAIGVFVVETTVLLGAAVGVLVGG